MSVVMARQRGRDHAEDIEIGSGEMPPEDERAPMGEQHPLEWQQGYDEYRATILAILNAPRAEPLRPMSHTVGEYTPKAASAAVGYGTGLGFELGAL